MGVTLTKRKNADGSTSLYLVIWKDKVRSYKFLKDLKLKPGDPDNKNTLDLAKRIAVEHAHQMQASDFSLTTEASKKIIATVWMQSYVDAYKKKDKRVVKKALDHFKEYSGKKQPIFSDITEKTVAGFQDYLLAKFTGEGPGSTFARFKKMMHAAAIELKIPNPAANVKTNKGEPTEKDTLTLAEIKLLSETHTESSEVKKAFLFSCVTGLRWCDVKTITWGNIKGNMISLRQGKTKAFVYIKLNSRALEIIGKPGKATDLLFELPTANGANKVLKAWVSRAEINKKITWHCARHSVGTNLALLETDMRTVGSMLGQKNMKYTMRYARAADRLKEIASDKLNY